MNKRTNFCAKLLNRLKICFLSFEKVKVFKSAAALLFENFWSKCQKTRKS